MLLSVLILADNSEPTPEPGEEETYRKDEVEDFFKRAFKMPAYQVFEITFFYVFIGILC